MLKTIAIIGGGNMGEALIKGLHQTSSVLVCEANKARTIYLKKKYRVTISNIPQAVKKASVIVLAVKPQDMMEILQNICRGDACHRPNIRRTQGSPLRNKLFISIAAGLTTKFFEDHLGRACIVRSMPNMPALIGEGITGICGGRYASLADIKAAQKILNTIGETVIVKESMIDAVTAVSGSGPAYVFLFVEQWMVAAKTLGFKEAEAKQLVYKTLVGSVHLLEQSEFDAGTLRAKVTSKGGTTQAALDIFSSRQFDKTMKDALLAAKKRAKELAK
jgi:pyrroline-5-carboxylate reductase